MLFFSFGYAQLSETDTILVTKNFKFKDGVYLSFEAFQQNKPDYSWKEVSSSVFINGDSFMSKAEDFILKTGGKVNFEDIWGFSFSGIPYIRIRNKADFATFAAIRVRGELCYFIYTEEVEKWIVIKAYNPVDGRPFRTGKVLKKESLVREKMLYFKTGKIEDFSVANFLPIVEKKDEQLWNALKDLSTEEARGKLFKCLLIYDDRHAVFTKE